MVRVSDLDGSLDFYCTKLGLVELRRYDEPKGRFTNVFLAAPGDDSAQVELTYNWDPEEYGAGRLVITHIPAPSPASKQRAVKSRSECRSSPPHSGVMAVPDLRLKSPAYRSTPSHRSVITDTSDRPFALIHSLITRDCGVFQ